MSAAQLLERLYYNRTLVSREQMGTKGQKSPYSVELKYDPVYRPEPAGHGFFSMID
jgi:hypothetical protein